MLKEMIDLQKKAVSELISVTQHKDEITFRAPTGSGKTYMMADYMNQILAENKNVVFLVSTLSKGNLADQNYEKFLKYMENGDFPHINPYLINSEISGEESLFIPIDCNVYLLPRDLYKKNSRLMKGGMEQFLNTLTLNKAFSGMEKDIYLIKDECHVATNNLDSLSDSFFKKVINFSATPKLTRGQTPDVEITDEEAVQVNLIKRVILGDDLDTVEDAINKFEEIKEEYRNSIGVNPCLIIQISNQEKANEELNNIIFPVLQKAEHQDLKWMYIAGKESEYDTNDILKAKKLPVNKWREFAKSDLSTIDIIIFKLVISEGWDIPRACMLYQIRETESEQLDEQVIGRVRRNPSLLSFEKLDEKAKELAMTSWVWGNLSNNIKKIRRVKLWDDPKDITDVFKLKTTRIKPLKTKKDFNIVEFINQQGENIKYEDIFKMYKKLENTDNEIKELCYEYADDYQKWWKFNDNIDNVVKESHSYVCDYKKSMELKRDEDGNILETSFPLNSTYVDDSNYENISDWIWKRCDGSEKFSFDSEAEREWADILKDISYKGFIKKVVVGKANPNAGAINIFGEEEEDKINPTEKKLWGKNFLTDSNIKYEYYLNGIYSSYPDFIMMDNKNIIHIFEVKSLNVSNNSKININSEQYIKKIEELKKCYKQASILTGHIFYLPVLKNDNWYITRYINGEKEEITKEQFIESLK